ncbi:hypothetical protein LLE49_09740 [Alicyclobacillus tolerans]|uniref:hypothetical protein n=1 Tax=Alicyclobacillus tolerans TaxID=90970 RepID=UPI001F37528E|nr:hypothetical protein [Alicyclobacillus tolerans]MCF8564997.1 hypothetical protein [Alicyclobacillus tolerans]
MITKPLWTDVMTAWGTLVSAIVTCAAVIVALWQSYEARKDADRTKIDILQTRKDEFVPLVSLDWGQAVVEPIIDPNTPHGGDLKTIFFRVTNVGRAPALNVLVEVDGYGITSYIIDQENPNSYIPTPKVHLIEGKFVDLVKEFTIRVVMPQTLRVRLSYQSVIGNTYCSDWFKFKPEHRARVVVNDFVIPSTPITDLSIE